MEMLQSFLVVLFWFTVRLGLPVLITVLLVVFLRKLDAHWQQEEAMKAPRLARNTRCWEQHHCSEDKRAVCPAYARPDIPCWQVFRTKEGFLREQCLGCETFRNAPVPVP